MKIQIDPKLITLNDIIELEDLPDVPKKARIMRDIVARVLIDDTGAPMPIATAQQILGKLNLAEVTEVFVKFREAVNEANRTAVPPTNGGRS